MRAVLIGVGGATAAAVAYGVSRAADGLVGAAAFELALFTLPLTLGLVLAQRTIAAPCTPRSVLERSVAAQVYPDLESVQAVACTSCGGKRALRGSVWVCGVCDPV